MAYLTNTMLARQNKRISNEESMSQALSRAADTAQDLTGGLESVRDSLRDRFATTGIIAAGVTQSAVAL